MATAAGWPQRAAQASEHSAELIRPGCEAVVLVGCQITDIASE